MRIILIALLLVGCGSSSPESTIEEPVISEPIIELDINDGGIQDFTLVDDHIYALSENYNDLTKITKLSMSGEFISETNYSDVAGHQGLTTDDNGYFWSTSHGESNKIVKFKDDSFVYTLTDLMGKSTTPAIGGDYLVAQTPGKIRVWYLWDFTEEGDYSDKYLYEFDSPEGVLQGIATDGVLIWIITGWAELEEKPLYTYTLEGEFISKEYIDNGLAKAGTEGTRYEPEGLDYHDGYLYVGLVTGSSGARISRIHRL